MEGHPYCTSHVSKPDVTGPQGPPFIPLKVVHLSFCFFLVLWINL